MATPLALVLLVLVLLLMAQLIQPKISTQTPAINITTINFIQSTPFKHQVSSPASVQPEEESPPKETEQQPKAPITKPLLLPQNSPSFELDTMSLPRAQFSAPASLRDLAYEVKPQLAPAIEQPVKKAPPLQTPLAPQFTLNLFPLHTPQPIYPRRARSRGIEGTVKVGFTIEPNGKVSNIDILNATPSGVFDNATRRSVAQWKFKPQLLEGKPTRRRVEQTIRFTLKR